MIVDALRANDVRVEYLEFAGEHCGDIILVDDGFDTAVVTAYIPVHRNATTAATDST